MLPPRRLSPRLSRASAQCRKLLVDALADAFGLVLPPGSPDAMQHRTRIGGDLPDWAEGAATERLGRDPGQEFLVVQPTAAWERW